MMKFCRALGWLAILIVMGSLQSDLLGAEQAQPAVPASKEKKPTYRRLPPYYGEVVKPDQRKAIYAIQEEYGPKIDALKAQLEALIRERDEKIASILTEEQRRKVEQLREEAKAKRASPKEAASKDQQTPSPEAKVLTTPEKPKESQKSTPEKPATLEEPKPKT